MAWRKLKQIRLVSNDGKAQPPFPGGWVLAIFDSVNAFAPELAGKFRLRTSERTQMRLKSGEQVKDSTYKEAENCLIELVTALFPKVSAMNNFGRKYVNEYFRLWKDSGEIGQTWAKHQGWEPQPAGVLSRALLRDFVLRLCYLESCNRLLSGKCFDKVKLNLLRHHTPALVYDTLITERKNRDHYSLECLAGKLGVYEKKLRRIKKGSILPAWPLLSKLADSKHDWRILACIGFIDTLVRYLGLNDAEMDAELLQVADIFLSHHHDLLLTTDRIKSFPKKAAESDYLLLHPGLDNLWFKMPDALWRAHLYCLQFARPVDLAQAYFQFSQPEIEDYLKTFLDAAEQESNGSPHAWMRELKHQKDAAYLRCRQ